MNRRIFLAASAAWALAGCTVRNPAPPPAVVEPVMLVPKAPEIFPIEAVDLSRIDRRYWRQVVPDPTGERPGTIVVDPDAKFLWLVMEGGRAMRYGVGVGRDGFGWSGTATIARKAEWPTWTPPREMIAREPELARYAGGMAGGPENPLGARALYLYQGGRDTLYRLHGTGEPWSIGKAVSSGCIRLLNVDVIDLYDRVPRGSRVVVRQSAGGAQA
ncbi:L,D-transpeptidase [Propylenella binzhouense]|uniref:L,D-transpeptidase n=1 Tax=Propylenella binzhouense TaxID=2555902 RepID=A0A964WVZ4_9HYPH|nr:L,D-transpeptidase [Propylenella binzhouense]MYZ50553.1 L,D-transpeptidase [Propylenella binzhouense]